MNSTVTTEVPLPRAGTASGFVASVADGGTTGSGRREPDWRLCWWWVVIGVTSALVGWIVNGGLLIAKDLDMVDFTLYGGTVNATNIIIVLAVALLQARVLRTHKVSAVMWVVVGVVYVATYPVLMVVWNEFLRGVLISYSPEVEWDLIAATVLLPYSILVVVSAMQGLVLAGLGTKRFRVSRAGWWLLAIVLGYFASMVAILVRTATEVVVLVGAPDLSPMVPIALGMITAGVVSAAITSTVQGTTLALMFREGEAEEQPYSPFVDGHPVGVVSAR